MAEMLKTHLTSAVNVLTLLTSDNELAERLFTASMLWTKRQDCHSLFTMLFYVSISLEHIQKLVLRDYQMLLYIMITRYLETPTEVAEIYPTEALAYLFRPLYHVKNIHDCNYSFPYYVQVWNTAMFECFNRCL